MLPRNKEKKPAAVKLKGEKVVHEEMHILRGRASGKRAPRQSQGKTVSPSRSISRRFCSVRLHEEMPKNRQKRPDWPDDSGKFEKLFSVPVHDKLFRLDRDQGFAFQEDTTFEDVLADVKEQFEAGAYVREKIAMHMNGYVRIWRSIFLCGWCPLKIKRYFLMAGANLGSRCITAVYSNIGILKFPEEYRNYIERFGILRKHGFPSALFLFLRGIKWSWASPRSSRTTASSGISCRS